MTKTKPIELTQKKEYRELVTVDIDKELKEIKDLVVEIRIIADKEEK